MHANFLQNKDILKEVKCVIILLLAGSYGYTQSSGSPVQSRYVGIGTYSQHFTDAFSGTANQGALAEAEQITAGLYSERRFLLKEMSYYQGAVVLPAGFGAIGIAFNYFGAEPFNTSAIGIGFGKKLGKIVSIGIQFNYNDVRLQGYGSASTINFEAGLLLHLTEKLHGGLHVYNPTGGRFGRGAKEKLASMYSTGLGYELSDKVLLSAGICHEEGKSVNITTTVEYNFANRFFLRAGIATDTGNFFFGLGLQLKLCRLDVNNSWQAPLGYTPGIMLLFQPKPAHQPAPLEK